MGGGIFFIFAIILAALDFFIPFFLLKGIPSFLASYLFWSLLTLAMVIFGAIYTRGWGNSS